MVTAAISYSYVFIAHSYLSGLFPWFSVRSSKSDGEEGKGLEVRLLDVTLTNEVVLSEKRSVTSRCYQDDSTDTINFQVRFLLQVIVA